jgi:hypothetical protein
VFTDGWGIDGVWDFDDGVEQFDMTAVSGLDNFSQLTITDRTTPQGLAFADVAFGGSNIFVVGVLAAQLTGVDFLL